MSAHANKHISHLELWSVCSNLHHPPSLPWRRLPFCPPVSHPRLDDASRKLVTWEWKMMGSGEVLLSSQHRPEILSLRYHHLPSDKQSLIVTAFVLKRSHSRFVLCVRRAREEHLRYWINKPVSDCWVMLNHNNRALCCFLCFHIYLSSVRSLEPSFIYFAHVLRLKSIVR